MAGKLAVVAAVEVVSVVSVVSVVLAGKRRGNLILAPPPIPTRWPDCIMKLDGGKKAHRCCCESHCQQQAEEPVCVCVCGRVLEREPTGFSVLWHVLPHLEEGGGGGGGVGFVHEVCGRGQSWQNLKGRRPG